MASRRRRHRRGSRERHVYDDGLAVVELQLDPVEAARDLEAYGAGSSPVIPVRWSLARPPVGPEVALEEDQRAAAAVRFEQLVAGLRPRGPLPPGLHLTREPSWGVGQRYGPRTPLVLAHQAVLLQATGDDLIGLLETSSVVDRHGSLTYPVSVARTAARSVGLAAPLRRLGDDVHLLCSAIGGRWLRRPFRHLLDAVDADALPARERSHLADNVRHLFADALTAAASVEALDDALPDETRLAGLGPFQAGFQAPGRAPGAAWLAPESVMLEVRHLLADLAHGDVVECARAHRTAAHDDAYADAVGYLRARAVTAAAHAPDARGLLHPDQVVGASAALAATGLVGAWQEWVTALTAVVVLRRKVPTDVLASFQAGCPGWLPPFVQAA